MTNYGSEALDDEMTTRFVRQAWKRCEFCKSKPMYHYIQHYSPIFHDGQVWCDACCSYLGMWETKVNDLLEQRILQNA